MTERLVRASVLRGMSSANGLDLLDANGTLHRLEGDGAELARAVLTFCEQARTHGEILAFVEAETGTPLGERASVVHALIALLERTGALTAPPSALVRGSGRVIVALAGAIAAAHAPLLVQILIARGHEVRVIATETALRFVSREALEALTHAPVRASMASTAEMAVPHVELARWADAMLVWPATATTIGRIATGDCSELVSAVAITTRAPVLIAPSMNEAMLDAPSVARNLETLRADRFHLTEMALAHEVADRPDRRAPIRGGAPDPKTLAALLEALLRTSVTGLPRDAAGWERFHRVVPESEHAWAGDADPVVLQLLDAHAARGSLWDVGTGTGAIAIAAAARGHRVVATEIAESALARASARDPSGAIVWLRDDVTSSALHGRFETIVDHGTLHVLPIEKREAWARAIRARLAPNGLVIVTSHLPSEKVLSHPITAAELAALLGDAFAIVASIEGTLSGAPAITTALRLRS